VDGSEQFLPAGEVNVLVYFGERRGQQYDVQHQTKMNEDEYSYATSAKTHLQATESERFLTVLAPHDSDVGGDAAADAVTVERTNQLQAAITIGDDDLTVTFGRNDDWSVQRTV
jgi:hypothetical protein